MGQTRLSRDRDSKSFVDCYPSHDTRGIWPLVEQFAPERRRTRPPSSSFPSSACPVRSAPPFDVWSAGRRGAPVADHHLGRDLGHFPLPAGKKVKIGAHGLGGKYFHNLSQACFV